MNRWQLVLRSLVHQRGMHAATALGMAVATAVIVGALMVGDSVRDSLQRLTMERLGRIDHLLLAHQFFRAPLTEQLLEDSRFPTGASAVSAILLPRVTVETRVENGKSAARQNEVLLLGITPDFWDFESTADRRLSSPANRQVVVNRQLADSLGIDVGDTILVRLPEQQAVAAETPFGRRDAAIRALVGLEVAEILPNRGLGRFDLQPTQRTPSLLFVDLLTVQRGLEQEGQANAIFVGGSSPEESTTVDLNRALQPSLADFGIRVDRVAGRYGGVDESAPPQTAWEYYHVTTDELLFRPPAGRAVREALADHRPQEVFTYLVNSIRRMDGAGPTRAIPYSLAAALDNHPRLGPLTEADGTMLPPLNDNEIAVNQWVADQLSARVGDTIQLDYYLPETTHGDPAESSIQLRLAAIVPLVRPATPFRRTREARFERPPGRANDPHLTPEVEGVTDQNTIADWDAPFPFDAGRLKRADDEYWDLYRTTPKVFVALATGQRLWGSRFGATTSFRIPIDAGASRTGISTAMEGCLHDTQQPLGFSFRPIKQEGMAAATGTTPFEYLFLGFSLFLLGSAAMLVGLLIALSLELRHREIGLLRAVGWRAPTVRLALWQEWCLVACGGAFLGLAVGTLYAGLMVFGLRTWWLAAVVAPVVQLAVTTRALLIGLAVSLIVSLVMIGWILRRACRIEPRGLLLGDVPGKAVTRRRGSSLWIMGLFALAIVVSCMALRTRGEMQAGGFFASGSLTLVAGVMICRRFLLEQASTHDNLSLRRLDQLALRSAARRPGRSLLTIGLVGSAAFLLLAISAFRLAPTANGTGGFELLAETDRPLYVDFRDSERVQELWDDRGRDTPRTAAPQIVGFSVRRGDDASCRNLFQTSQPRLIGVSPAVAELLSNRQDSFALVGGDQPWQALMRTPNRAGNSPENAIPVILDQNTARYGLKLYGGVGQEFTLRYDTTMLRFRVAGLLSNSILQGSLLIGTEHLVANFPAVSGEQLFLVDTGQDTPDTEVRAASNWLEQTWSDQGMDAESARELLSDLLAVQNTYLSTFQSLGGFGLLLGTLGLAVVEVRNILERRGELALLMAVGWRMASVRRLVIAEHTGLLLAGLAVGLLAALVTVLPHQWAGAARPSWLPVGSMLVMIGLSGWLTTTLACRWFLGHQILTTLRADR